MVATKAGASSGRIKGMGTVLVALVVPVSVVVVVGGIARAMAPTGQYQVSASTVYDTKTKLTWQRAESPTTLPTYTTPVPTDYVTPSQYCERLALEGGGWRLPTANELLSLVDEAATSGPAIDVVAFPNATTRKLWTSSSIIVVKAAPVLVDFTDGSTTTGSATGAPGDPGSPTYGTRCVR